MDELLHLNLGGLVFWLCLIPTASATLMYLVTQHGPLAAPLQSLHGVVAPFFASVGIVFAVTMIALAIHERPLSDPTLVSMGQLKHIVGKAFDF